MIGIKNLTNSLKTALEKVEGGFRLQDAIYSSIYKNNKFRSLQFSVSQILQDFNYLEIGYGDATGLKTILDASDNKANIFAIDDFSFPRKDKKSNLDISKEKLQESDKIHLINKDFLGVNFSEIDKIDWYLYDANHTNYFQSKCLLNVQDCFADEIMIWITENEYKIVKDAIETGLRNKNFLFSLEYNVFLQHGYDTQVRIMFLRKK